MKVLQVVAGVRPRYGGRSVALTDKTRMLIKRGVGTTLVATNLGGDGYGLVRGELSWGAAWDHFARIYRGLALDQWGLAQ
jgi:hypothetical protein